MSVLFDLVVVFITIYFLIKYIKLLTDMRKNFKLKKDYDPLRIRSSFRGNWYDDYDVDQNDAKFIEFNNRVVDFRKKTFFGMALFAIAFLASILQ